MLSPASDAVLNAEEDVARADGGADGAIDPVVGGRASDPRPARVVGVGAAVQGTAVLPVFLIGALGVQIQSDLGLSASQLGSLTGVFIASRMVFSASLGALVDRFGGLRSMRASAIGCGLVSLSVALFATSWLALVISMIFGGMVQAGSQPAANRFVLRYIPPGRLGLAFGIKQSGAPVATVFAGLSVPLIALTIGWRWGFGIGAVLALLTFLVIPRRSEEAKARARTAVRTKVKPGLGLAAVGFSFILAAINSMGTFIVVSGVDAGIDPGAAGLLLSAGGFLAIIVRVVVGILADRRGARHFRFVALQILVGAGCYVGLSLGIPWLYVLAALVAYASIWSFQGVFFMAVVQHDLGAPAAATGRVISIGSIGGFSGAPVFGYVADTFGFGPAWLMTAGWAVIGAVAVGLAARRQEQGRRDEVSAG